MNIQQLQYVLAVHDHGSFGRAAEKCFVTQSTLSTMIARLEDELGVVIFDRKKKPVVATREGEVLMTQMKLILKEIDNLHEVIDELKGVITGTLKIGVIPTIAPFLLPLFFDQFMKKIPRLKFVISEMTTERIIEGIINRELDIGILSTPLNHKDIVEHKLYDEPFFLYDQQLTTDNQSVTSQSIDCSRLWLLEEGHCFRNQVEIICDLKKDRDSYWNMEYKSGSIETLMRFVKKYNGLTLLPLLATLEFAQSEKKFLHTFTDPVPMREISLVTHRHFVKNSILKILQDQITRTVLPIIGTIKSSTWKVSPI